MGSVTATKVKAELGITEATYDTAIGQIITSIAADVTEYVGSTVDPTSCTAHQEMVMMLGVKAQTLFAVLTGNSGGVMFAADGLSVNPSTDERIKTLWWQYQSKLKDLPRNFSAKYYVYGVS